MENSSGRRSSYTSLRGVSGSLLTSILYTKTGQPSSLWHRPDPEPLSPPLQANGPTRGPMIPRTVDARTGCRRRNRPDLEPGQLPHPFVDAFGIGHEEVLQGPGERHRRDVGAADPHQGPVELEHQLLGDGRHDLRARAEIGRAHV